MMRTLIAVAAMVVTAGCPGRQPVTCEDDSHCNLFGGGLCALGSGERWCAYPDQGCDSGYRFGDEGVSDAVQGMCVANAPTDASPDAATPTVFAMAYGGAGDETILSVHRVNGGVVLVGTLGADCIIGGELVTYGGGLDSVIVKLDNIGQTVWIRPFNQREHDGIQGSGIDANGDVLVAGHFGGTVNLGGSDLVGAGGYDIFVAKYRGDTGEHVWSARYGLADNDYASGAAVDTDGNVYVGGYFSGTTNLGSIDLASNGGVDGFAAKFSGADGSPLWSRAYGGTQQDSITGVASSGTRVILSGTFTGTMPLTSGTLSSRGLADAFVASSDSSTGNILWARGIGGVGNDRINAIAADGTALYAAGYLNSAFDFGNGPVTPTGVTDAYVFRYLLTGTYSWARTYGSGGNEAAWAIAADGERVLVAGDFDTEIDFGGGPLYSAGQTDAFIATLSGEAGAYLDGWRAGGAGADQASALSSSTNALVVGGRFQGVINLGSEQKESLGGADAFVLAR